MIIGVNGKIGSGKDTVGKIIQWLTKPEPDGQYIGFQTYDDSTLEKLSPFKIKKFAGKLKQIASLLTDVPVEMFEDQEFKKQEMPEGWGMTYRTFLQKLGTEGMRVGVHTNIWINALFADYHPTPNKSMDESFKEQFITGRSEIHYSLPNWIITDMRFPNEMEAVVKKGGITIRVVRDNWKPKVGDTILIKVFSEWSTVTYIHTYSEGNHFGIGTDGYKYKSSQIKQSNLHPSQTTLDDAKRSEEHTSDS